MNKKNLPLKILKELETVRLDILKVVRESEDFEIVNDKINTFKIIDKDPNSDFYFLLHHQYLKMEE